MGTWGVGAFENDGACDHAAGVIDGGGTGLVEEALDRVLETGDDYLEAPEAEEAIAAAEIVARLLGRPGPASDYTAELDAWISRSKPAANSGLAAKAAQAVRRILREPSELLELWQESDDLETWQTSVYDLLTRLQTA